MYIHYISTQKKTKLNTSVIIQLTFSNFNNLNLQKEKCQSA